VSPYLQHKPQIFLTLSTLPAPNVERLNCWFIYSFLFVWVEFLEPPPLVFLSALSVALIFPLPLFARFPFAARDPRCSSFARPLKLRPTYLLPALRLSRDVLLSHFPRWQLCIKAHTEWQQEIAVINRTARREGIARDLCQLKPR
jgi:hypothetical protein